MKSFLKVIREQIENFYLIRRLSVFEVKSQNRNNYLGILWELIKPMILTSIYAFVFGVGIRGGRETGSEVDFLPWLLAGIVIWFFFNPALTNGSKAIYTRIQMISKMNFPVSVIPTYVILSKLYAHLFFVILIFIILQFWHFTPTIYLLQLPYYTFATVVLLVSICMLTSTLSTIARDVQMFITSTTRMLLYLSPILWNPEVKGLPDWIVSVMKLNPLYYVVEGYRHSLLGESWYFLENPQYTLYFWFIVLLFLIFGSILHMKFRDRFVEFI